jgi:hypothetical protein
MAVNLNQVQVDQIRRVVESMGWKVRATSEEASLLVVEIVRAKADDSTPAR